MEDPSQRYQKLALTESFSRIYLYPSACRELALILKLSYSQFPKNLQSIVFQDALTAFRLLPRMQTQTAVSAANTLLQGVESALPKQKKAMAVTEFKHAMVAHKRFSKARQDAEDLAQLPEDVLVHIFSFLDLKSLVSASQVCRSWNAASSDNLLWQLMYTMFIYYFYNFSRVDMLYGGSIKNYSIVRSSLDWKTIFKKAYEGTSSKKLITSSRGICKHCHAIVWLSDMVSKTSKFDCKYHEIQPISNRQVVEYLDGEYGSSDSDSDGDESTSKLWAYSRRKRNVFSY